ncbi:GH19977 [Drosophila grimshawi]|uniref:GH19977 n=2 Tax=Drosophila grimshawi TaxID=7222 RepID=B4J8C7_DROGR|nr:GH19977 [Drosophila grimshawi]
MDGIDNEALDLFMQAACVGNLDEAPQPHSHSHNHNHNPNEELANVVGISKLEAPHTPPMNLLDAELATGRGSAMAMPLAHLPESPPDSGSEPAYSPLGETHALNGREIIYTGLGNMQQQQQQQQQMLQADLQFTSPPPPLVQQQHHFVAPAHDVRVKHETGIGNSLLCQQQQQQQQQLNCEQQLMPLQHQQLQNLPQDPLPFPHYDNGHVLYGSGSYQNLSSMSTCMLTSPLGLGDRVQVIGTSQLSLTSSTPTTPMHSLSRKRKMSTQLDCPEFGPMAKHDPGLQMSPLRSSHHAIAIAPSSSSPSEHDLSKTPAHSHCSASVSPALSAINSQTENSLDGPASNAAAGCGSGSGSGSEAGDPTLTQCIRFSPFQPENWHKLCDQNLHELSVIYYRVDADKGFNFSVSDDAYVCQKKNHFQVTCHARLQGDAKFVKTPSGLEKIKSFHLHFYGVKFEAPNQTIRVEQSQSDRSKKPFYPVPIDLQSHIVSKITVGRLHFSETTNNNMRKKGRPNPEQRFFQLVVGLHVHTTSGHFPVVSHGSERIIVRASNPGQFESDVDLVWQRGITQESIFHAGRVGINTDRPDESLVVHGNLKVSGHIVQPSDSRAKQEIAELDTSVQLRNMQKIRIVRYRYEPEYAVHSGLRRESDTREIVDTGVIAQEVREVIPDAVQEAGSVVLPNGNVIENFLLVNKDRILMENIGAVKELCKVTGSLESRIESLERANTNHNNHQLRAKDLLEPRCLLPPRPQQKPNNRSNDGYEICSSRLMQIIIFMLIIIMAACLAAVSTLYFVEHNKQQQHLDGFQMFGDSRLFRPDASATRLSDEDRLNFQHSWQTLFKNKTHGSWPSLIFAASTTRPTVRHIEGADELQQEEEELTAVMNNPQGNLALPKQPHTRITTTAPRNNSNNTNHNKTIVSKNKSKWPVSQEALRPVASQKLLQSVRTVSRILAASSNDTDSSSSEKPAGIAPLSQDFENNSIDVDAQQQQQQLRQQQQQQPLKPSSKLDEQIVVLGTIPSTIVDNAPVASAGQAIRKLNAGDAAIYNVYKTVSPPTANLALTTNKVSTEQSHPQSTLSLAMDVPPPAVLRNSSGGKDSVDALDLQNLSNTNESESVDNPVTALFGFEYPSLRDSNVGRRSANQRSLDWIRHKSLRTPLFGQPPECNGDETVSDNCQSTCFVELQPAAVAVDNVDANVKHQHVEDELPSAEQEQDADILIIQPVAAVSNDSSSSSSNMAPASRVYHGKSSHNTVARTKQFSTETDGSSSSAANSDQDDALYTVLSVAPAATASLAAGHVELPIAAPVATMVTPLPPQPDCWSISSCVLAGQNNYTIDVEQFCPSSGSSLNVSYAVPVSRYLQAVSLELHFSSSKPLQWSICSDEDKSKAQLNEDSDEAPPSTWVKVLKQLGNNKLILAVDIPNRGNFLRDFMLRASPDLEQQKLCDDNAHVANPILQYNFSIVRDCD